MSAHDTPSQRAAGDLALVRELVRRTDRRIDPHSFHYVHWGAIVLVWYPLSNWFQLRGDYTAMIVLGVSCVVLGMVLSIVREARLAKRPRLPGENTVISTQMQWITLVSVGAGMALSALGPWLGFIEGRAVPTLWGLVYANMAVMIGVVYRREFLWSGLGIFLGAVAAMALPDWNGYILGPVMGFGLIVPGLMAERRVGRLRADVGDDA